MYTARNRWFKNPRQLRSIVAMLIVVQNPDWGGGPELYDMICAQTGRGAAGR